uniref:Uncharacterized protein n=1 Tax=Anguilla anguilla TaxID=7936 RepID=A0A0E9XSR0_ANGAN
MWTTSRGLMFHSKACVGLSVDSCMHGRGVYVLDEYMLVFYIFLLTMCNPVALLAGYLLICENSFFGEK